MDNVTLAEAKAHLSALVERAANGDEITITRRGKPVARIVSAAREAKPIAVEALRALTDAMPLDPEPAGEWLRKIRDAQRY